MTSRLCDGGAKLVGRGCWSNDTGIVALAGTRARLVSESDSSARGGRRASGQRRRQCDSEAGAVTIAGFQDRPNSPQHIEAAATVRRVAVVL